MNWPDQSKLAVPFRNRVALALALVAMMILAGWGRPWWVVLLACAPWPGLVAIGIWRDTR